MTTPRPKYRTAWAQNAGTREEPAGGTEASGYPYGMIPPYKGWNWLHGYAGDWQSYMDDQALRSTDLVSGALAQRITAGKLGFTIAGPLAQRPSTGGVYYIGAERVDMSLTGIDAPVFNFTANSTNYIWARSPSASSRLGYADRAITTVLVSPGAGYAHVATVTTGPLTVTVVSEPATVLYAHVWNDTPQWHLGPVIYQPTGTATPQDVQVPDGAAAGTRYSPQAAGFVGPMIDMTLNRTGVGMYGLPEGTGLDLGKLVSARLKDRGAAVFADTDGPFVSGMATVVSRLLGQGFDLAFEPGGAAPIEDGNLAGHLRVYTELQTTGGGLRWLEPTTGGIRMPMVGRDGFVLASTTGANTAFLTSGAGTTTIVSSPVISLRQDHTYLVWAAAETQSSSAAAFAVSYGIRVGASLVTPGGVAINLQPLTALAVNNPWLGCLYSYTHTAADTTGQARIEVTHGAAGAGNVSYRLPRIFIFGGWR